MGDEDTSSGNSRTMRDMTILATPGAMMKGKAGSLPGGKVPVVI